MSTTLVLSCNCASELNMSSNKQEVCLNPDIVDQISLSDHPNLMETLEESEDGMTYRVIQVDTIKDSLSCSEHLSTSLHSTSEYTDNQNDSLSGGEFYVLHPGTELCTTIASTKATSKPVANGSRHNPLRIRDARKRASHNEVERRRRDKINSWILTLGKLIPQDQSSDKNCDILTLQSKGAILAKACDHILELKTKNQNLEKYIKANEQLVSKLDKLSKQNSDLNHENMMLRNMLRENGLSLDFNNVPIKEECGIPNESDHDPS